VRRRLAELAAPLLPDPALPETREVAVCLYSYNKAALLGRTLARLAATALGRAGCGCW
jgi:hypothetical protein